jgi:hypothetical protein
MGRLASIKHARWTGNPLENAEKNKVDRQPPGVMNKS